MSMANRTGALNAPKILPWMARRAGIDDEQAVHLWQRAVAESAQSSGQLEGASCHAEVMNRFINTLPINS